MYYFIKNLQGDVIAIVDKDTQTVARYSYDAWGKCTIAQDSVGIATINPFRYRGYFYDEEIGMYYLQSRYYDAVSRRFINVDEATYLGISGTVLGYNLFTYCENNPINFADPVGCKAIDITSKLTDLMRTNALKFAAYIISQVFFKGVAKGMINAFKYFYNNSKTGGKWDLKNLKKWKLSKGDWFIFKGKKLRIDDPGNIHFGYVGSVMFPIKILQAGVGVYQIYSGTSKWKYWCPFFDDPRDSKMILYGNILFKTDILKSIVKVLSTRNKFKIYWM